MKYSITIPAYKSRYLREAIESVLSQTYTDWELVIVDDYSPEDLASVVNPYLSDERIHYYRNEKNCGAIEVVDNWNICLSYCTGDYVICMGDDDRLLPCCLDEYSKLIEKYPGLNVYHARTEIIDENGKLINLQEPRPEWESALSMIWNRWASRNMQYIGDFCYRTEYLKAVGGYYKLPLAWGADDVTAVQAAAQRGIANTQEFCFQYRENPLTISSSRTNAFVKLQATLEQMKWFKQFFLGIQAEDLTISDAAYLDTIELHQRNFFMKSLGKDCIDGTRGNPLPLLRFYRQLRHLHYPKSMYLKWYISSVFHLFFSRN